MLLVWSSTVMAPSATSSTPSTNFSSFPHPSDAIHVKKLMLRAFWAALRIPRASSIRTNRTTALAFGFVRRFSNIIWNCSVDAEWGTFSLTAIQMFLALASPMNAFIPESPYCPSDETIETYDQLKVWTTSTKASAWKVSGGTVRAKKSYRVLSEREVPVEA